MKAKYKVLLNISHLSCITNSYAGSEKSGVSTSSVPLKKKRRQYENKDPSNEETGGA